MPTKSIIKGVLVPLPLSDPQTFQLSLRIGQESVHFEYTTDKSMYGVARRLATEHKLDEQQHCAIYWWINEVTGGQIYQRYDVRTLTGDLPTSTERTMSELDITALGLELATPTTTPIPSNLEEAISPDVKAPDSCHSKAEAGRRALGSGARKERRHKPMKNAVRKSARTRKLRRADVDEGVF